MCCFNCLTTRLPPIITNDITPVYDVYWTVHVVVVVLSVILNKYNPVRSGKGCNYYNHKFQLRPRNISQMSPSSNYQTHLSSHSSCLSRLSARDQAEPPQGETHEPEDGQQVGECRGVHRRDAERGAGLPHARRPHQSPALTSVRLPSRGTTGRVTVWRARTRDWL